MSYFIIWAPSPYDASVIDKVETAEEAAMVIARRRVEYSFSLSVRVISGEEIAEPRLSAANDDY